MSDVQYEGSLSSGTKKTTTQANQVIDFGTVYISQNTSAPTGTEIYVTNLTIENFAATAIHVQLNNEATVHEIDANSNINISQMPISKFLIQESGVQYRWSALY